ncbi:response regulator transcription factor [Streptomyces sp. NBC_00237]|uniref:response regulator n=1 Tax=Streptomyces sp. NBC_00237 TaxID=2975687 RepID=UPI002259AB77|nr:response regulator transcription factor [Streptomyces sp. NBC_00237]MCX5205664.1 response regulator transcription factor [Streptomyces sp. NBC_00237]
MIVDDDAIISQALALIVELSPNLHVVARIRDGAEALEAVRSLQSDVVLMDIRMPRMDGIAATSAINSALSDPPRIIILTTFGQDDYIQAALQAGAAGFLLKDTEPEALLQAIEVVHAVVHAGEAMLSPAVTRRLIESYEPAPPALPAAQQQAIASLSVRERDVLPAVARGPSNAETAAELKVTEATVKSHLGSVIGKLGTSNRVQAAILAHSAGLTGRSPGTG